MEPPQKLPTNSRRRGRKHRQCRRACPLDLVSIYNDATTNRRTKRAILKILEYQAQRLAACRPRPSCSVKKALSLPAHRLSEHEAPLATIVEVDEVDEVDDISWGTIACAR